MSELTLAIIAVSVILYAFPILMVLLGDPPQWLDDWMDERAEKRQKRRAERQKRKKPA